MKKSLKGISMAVAMMAVGSMSVCPVMAEELPDTTFTFASWALAEETLEPIYASTATTFMDQNPNVTIELDGSQAYSTYLDQLLVSAISGTAPNVAHIKEEWLPQLLDTGAVKTIVGISDEVMADYSESAIESVTVDGEMKAMPWFANTVAVFCNTELAEEAGVDIDAISCWQELVEAAEKVSDLGSDIYGLAFPDSEVETGEGYNVLPVLWAHGAELITDDQISLTSDESVEAYTELQHLFQDGISPKGLTLKELRNLFGQGKIGFYYDLQQSIPTAASVAEDEATFYDNFKCIEIPAQNDAHGAGYLSSHFLVVFDTTTDDQMPAVSAYLEHMSSADVIQILYDAGLGKMSTRASVNEEVFAGTDDITAIYAQAMESARALPVRQLDMAEVDNAMVKALTQIANGNDVKTVLEALQGELTALLK